MRFAVCYRLLFVALFFVSVAVRAAEPAWEESPYRVGIYTLTRDGLQLPREFVRTVRQRCAVHWGAYWTVQVVEPSAELRQFLRTEFAESGELPEEWKNFDKIFIADFSSERLELREFDTVTNWLGPKFSSPLGNASKFEDVLIQGLDEVFSPIGRVEQSSAEQATLLLRGKNLLLPSMSVRGEIFMPFVRTLDREAKVTQVDRIPWTVLIAEPEGPEFRGLRCRVESGVRSPLSLRRRGRTEIYALAAPTPQTPTLLRFVSRSEAAAKNIGTLPTYSVYEKISGEKDAVLIGKTAIDGIFLLESDADRLVRTLQVRDGTSLIAQFPIVRGWEAKAKVPIPDDVIRLEAEAALLGIQEEMIDQVARRDILRLRLKKFQELGNELQVREIRIELARLKDASRYRIELDQLRSRFHSPDPLVERRINRLFGDTRKMVDEFLQ